MTQRLRSECISCMLKTHLEKCPTDTTELKKVEYMQRILKVLAEAPQNAGSPVVVRSINAIQQELFGMNDIYTEVKRHFNFVMLEREQQIWKQIEKAQDALKLAIQYAMVGNYIDFGAMKHVDEQYLSNLLNTASEQTIDDAQYVALKEDLEKGKKLVFLTDNCGEVVMDKLLMKTIQKQYPQIQITAIVRGSEILNDATMEDAIQVGLTDIVKTIGNGNNIAGTCMEELSEEVREELEQADIIIAKGQGNYETLRGCGLNVYYIFLCKCHMFAENFGVPRFTGMLVNDKDSR